MRLDAAAGACGGREQGRAAARHRRRRGRRRHRAHHRRQDGGGDQGHLHHARPRPARFHAARLRRRRAAARRPHRARPRHGGRDRAALSRRLFGDRPADVRRQARLHPVAHDAAERALARRTSNAHVRAAGSAGASTNLRDDGFAADADPHRARARHALCRPGLRDHACRAPTRRCGPAGSQRCARSFDAQHQHDVRPHARRRSRSRSCPIACAASASCRRSRCRSSSATGATLDRRAARDAARALRRRGRSTARSISANSSTSA